MWERCQVIHLVDHNKVIVKHYRPAEEKHDLRDEIAHSESPTDFEQVLKELREEGWREISSASMIWPEAEKEPGAHFVWLVREIGT